MPANSWRPNGGAFCRWAGAWASDGGEQFIQVLTARSPGSESRNKTGSGSWLLLTSLVVLTGVSAYEHLRVLGAMINNPTLAAVASVRKEVMARGHPGVELSPSAVHYGMYVVIVLAAVGSV